MVHWYTNMHSSLPHCPFQPLFYKIYFWYWSFTYMTKPTNSTKHQSLIHLLILSKYCFISRLVHCSLTHISIGANAWVYISLLIYLELRVSYHAFSFTFLLTIFKLILNHVNFLEYSNIFLSNKISSKDSYKNFRWNNIIKIFHLFICNC